MRIKKNIFQKILFQKFLFQTLAVSAVLALAFRLLAKLFAAPACGG